MRAAEKEEIVGIVREAIEQVVAPIDARVKALEGTASRHAEQIASIADSMVKCSSAAANAADAAFKAQQRAGEVLDETTKIVQSALQIHNASITASVHSAVQETIKPLAKEVHALKANDAVQNEQLIQVLGLVKGIAKSLGSPWLRWALLVCAVLGATGGGCYFGYAAAKELKASSVAPAK